MRWAREARVSCSTAAQWFGEGGTCCWASSDSELAASASNTATSPKDFFSSAEVVRFSLRLVESEAASFDDDSIDFDSSEEAAAEMRGKRTL